MSILPHDYAFFYAGLEREELLIQKCEACHRLRNPPAPCCPYCRSLDWITENVSGKGILYSYVIHHHPPMPDVQLPHPVGLVDLKEGIRFIAGLKVKSLDDIAIGMPLRARFTRRGELTIVYFEEDSGR